MIKLSIPQIREDTKNVKDTVFTVLTQKQPLTMIKIYNRIKNAYNIHVTYQAVRKAVNTLIDQDVIIKNNKEYSLNKDWILKLKSFFDNLLLTYEKKQRTPTFNKELMKEDYAVYTFNNLFDLDNFWTHTIMYLLSKSENKIFFTYAHYSFWFLINLGNEIKLFKHVKKQNFDAYQLFLANVPLNRWGAKLYEDLGVKTKIISDNKIKDSVALNVIGNTITQVTYSEEITAKLRNIYRKYSSNQEISVQEITEIAHFPCDIKFVIYRNPTFAKNILDTYLKVF